MSIDSIYWELMPPNNLTSCYNIGSSIDFPLFHFQALNKKQCCFIVNNGMIAVELNENIKLAIKTTSDKMCSPQSLMWLMTFVGQCYLCSWGTLVATIYVNHNFSNKANKSIIGKKGHTTNGYIFFNQGYFLPMLDMIWLSQMIGKCLKTF